jgi:quinol monooxygenase YgiN
LATVLAFERHPVAPDNAEEFIGLLNDLLETMRSAPGALWADAARAGDDDPSWLVLSEWRTGADLDAWESSGPAVAFSQATDVLLRDDITRRRFGSQA